GIATGDDYANQYQKIIEKYDEGAQAASKAAAAQREMIAQARAAQSAMSTPDARTLLGLGAGGGSASSSAAVFQEMFAAQEEMARARAAQASAQAPSAATLLGLGGSGGSAAASAAVFQEVEEASKSLGAEMDRLTAKFQPLTVAGQEYDAVLA